jgi:hypothetical protein
MTGEPTTGNDWANVPNLVLSDNSHSGTGPPLLTVSTVVLAVTGALAVWGQLWALIVGYLLSALVAVPSILFSRLFASRREVDEGVAVSHARRRTASALLALSLTVCVLMAATVAWRLS